MKNIRQNILYFVCRLFMVKKGELIPKYLYPFTFLLFPIKTLFMIEAVPLKYDLLSDTIEIKGFRISVHFLESLTKRRQTITIIPDDKSKTITVTLIAGEVKA